MFRSSTSQLSVVIFLTVLLAFPDLSAQMQEHEIPAVKESAMTLFESGNYRAADESFEKLIRHFPRDPMYRYYSGISKVVGNYSLEEAVELLVFASSRGVPEDVYYYVGEAYRKLYDFEKARRYFLEFENKASRAMEKELKARLMVNSASKATEITSKYNPYTVINVTFMDLKDPAQYGQIRMKGGQLSVKPDALFHENEKKDDLNALMFIPEIIPRGGRVYFSGYERNDRDGFQIMQAKKGNTGKWTDITGVDLLNSEGDEILPYFDPVGKDLYFASNGREGLGGFDLYRSHFDEERKSWSDPVNLGFPINSAYDDYMLLPGSDLGKVIIFSARQSSDSAMTVYRVHLSEPKKELRNASPEEIRAIANFGNVAAEVLADYKKYRENELAGSSGSKPAEEQADEVNDEQTKKNAGSAGQEEIITRALMHQARSDSLTELSTDARVKVRESDDPNDRWLFQKQIIVWEKRAKEEREKADDLFAEINDRKEIKEIPSTIEKDTMINDITVYKYVDTDDGIEGVAKTAFTRNDQQHTPQPEETPQLKNEMTTKEQAEPVPSGEKAISGAVKTGAGLEILDQTSYNINNPVPVDSPLPKGALYRIQLAAYSSEQSYDKFGGMQPITAETIPDRGLIRYYAGEFKSYEKAVKALPLVRGKGYSDAFIVSWYDGTKMSAEKVRKLE